MTNRKNWRTGASACFAGKLDESVLEAYAKAGIRSTEISFRDPYYDEILWNEIPTWSSKTGTEVWSIHLPFSRTLNIAHEDPAVSAQSMVRLLDLVGRAGNAGIKVVVVHPSSEPIPDENREHFLKQSEENLGRLCARAEEFGMVVGVENLPRTCLGNCKEDILRFLNYNPTLRVCFDTNHLLKQTNESFIRAVGSKIVTLHVSDYDFVDERHVFPGDGLIDWKQLQTELEMVNYDGPFMYELNAKDQDGRRTLEDVKKNHLWLQSL